MVAVAVVGADALVQESFADTVIDDSPKLLQKDCIGVAAPDQHLVYADTGWTGARSQALRNNGDGACRYDVTNQAVDVLNAIAAKVPH